MANSAVFRGAIEQLPFIKNTLSANQTGKLSLDLELDVINPANPKQTRNVGKMFGFVPVDENNAYRYSDGPGVKVAVFPIGAPSGPFCLGPNPGSACGPGALTPLPRR